RAPDLRLRRGPVLVRRARDLRLHELAALGGLAQPDRLLPPHRERAVGRLLPGAQQQLLTPSDAGRAPGTPGARPAALLVHGEAEADADLSRWYSCTVLAGS